MKIALVAPGGFDCSGAERVIPVLPALTSRHARKHETHVYALHQSRYGEEYRLGDAAVHSLAAVQGRGAGIRRVARVVRAITRCGADARYNAVHAMWAGQGAVAACIAARRMRAPCVVSVLGGELVALRDIGYGSQLRARERFWVKLALRLATEVTTPSAYMLSKVRTRRPDALRIPFGPDCDLYSPGERLPIGPPWRLLHVANLNRVKDQGTLLRTARRLQDAGARFHLDVVGQDTLGGQIQRLAQELDLAPHVTFHGFLPTPRVAELYRASHLLLHTSRSEAGEIVTLEAAASGVPTVGTEVGHVADLAPTGAVSAPIGDSAALAEAALTLLRDEGAAQDIAACARRFVLCHDADWTADRLQALYAGSREDCVSPARTGEAPASR